MRLHAILPFLFVLIMAGCDEGRFEPLPDGTRYYPVRIGQASVFRSDSIIFDDVTGGNAKDTLSGFVREIVVDTFSSTSEGLALIVNRSFRATEGAPWSAPQVVLIRRGNQRAYRSEGNLQFTKMRFPLRSVSQWNPTELFDEQISVQIGTEFIEPYVNWSGEVLSMDVAESIGTFAFDSVMTCIQADDDNEIERRYVLEKYAAGVGLVYRTDTILDSRCKRLGDLEPCLDESWSEKGEKGYILRQEIISFE